MLASSVWLHLSTGSANTAVGAPKSIEGGFFGVPEHALVVRGTDAEEVAQIRDPARVWREPWTLQSLAKEIAYTCATPMMYLP